MKLSPGRRDFRDDPLRRDRLGDMAEFRVAAAQSHREGPRLLLAAQTQATSGRGPWVQACSSTCVEQVYIE